MINNYLLNKILGAFMLPLFLFLTSHVLVGQDLVINEVLADPAADAPGDANGDGTRSASDDEFIEFINVSNKTLDITGWQVLDTNSTVTVRHIFPENSLIPSGGALVLFGGGTPTGDFGYSVVQTASTGALGISNTSEMLMVVDAAEDTVIKVGYDDFNSDMSFTREPQYFGEFVMHTDAPGSDGALFSPGTQPDGKPFNYGLLVINEILADPAADEPGDANGDGTRSASDDEFIEFINIGNSPLDVSGWQVLDTNSQVLVRHIFPEKSIIPSGGALVVFGGGTPTGEFGGSIVQLASTGALGISNTNEQIMVVDAQEDTVIVVGYEDFNSDMSFTRDPEETGDFVEHSSATNSNGALFSPGTKADGTPFNYGKLIINEVLADPAADEPGDANGDGTRSASDDEFIEFANIGNIALDISGWQVLDTNSQVIVRHVFPEHTVIPPDGFLVLFGGGTPTGEFGGSIVQLASSGALGISNTNEQLLVVNVLEDTVITLGYEDFNSDMSHTRDPDFSGDFVQHSSASGANGALFSPGTKINGDPAAFTMLVINEVLADPASDEPGDANGDGTRSASDDEFIEFINAGNTALDISGWHVLDTNSTVRLRHIFPANSVIPSGGALVVFGGGNPTGEFGGSIVQLASTGSLGISNTNEQLLVVNAFSDTVITLGYEDFNSDMSHTRDPDITGEFVMHSSATGANGALFSPGTKINGASFSTGEIVNLVLNEILADPASDSPGDANGDGTRSASDDEFIEFVNRGDFDLDISGWQVLDTNSVVTVRHIFPDNTVVPSGGAIVVFGGGSPTGTFGNSIVQTASSGSLGISNSSEQIMVVDADEDTVIVLGYDDYGTDQSYTLDPDIEGTSYVTHSTATGSGGALFSPGTKIDGSFFIEPEETIVEFSSAGVTVDEGDGSTTLEITIAAASNSEATTVDVELIEGDAADIGGYTTQSITFAAGSEEANTISITITDDDDVESSDTLRFELVNIAGGTSAIIGETSIFELVITDNDFATSTLVINEFMAWPAGQDAQAGESPTVDSNGDGGIDIYEDEFIEFANGGSEDLDISGWKIYDEVTGNDPLRHVFPDGTVINPGGALVVFGGGNPTGEFGGTPWQLASMASQGLGMTNSGDVIIIRNANDETVMELAFGQQTRATSTTLNPDITGAIGPHPDLNGLNISPGTKVDGSSFVIPTSTEVMFAKASGGISESSTEDLVITLNIVRPDDAKATTAEIVMMTEGFESDLSYTTQTVIFPAGSSESQTVTISAIDDTEVEGDELYVLSIGTVTGGTNAKKGNPSTFEINLIDDDVPLLFNEIHADPASTEAGDANADGVSDASGDEFIEIVNISDASIDMSGWEFSDGTSVRHVFESGTVLASGKAVVVFGGGIPVGTFGGSIVQIASSGSLDLDDAGETLTITNTSAVVAAKTTYGALASDNQSISRDPDYYGGLTKHSTIENAQGALYSPGTKTDGSVFTSLVTSTQFGKNGILVYPNPALTQLNIIMEGITSSMDLVIYDLHGKHVENLHLSSGKLQVLDVADYERGVYIIELKLASGGPVIERRKVIFSE